MKHDEVMTIEELAAYLKITHRTLYQKVNNGEIPGKKVFGKWRFHKTAIDQWLFDFDTDKFGNLQKNLLPDKAKNSSTYSKAKKTKK